MDLGRCGYALRIVTPGAIQGAALEKSSRPDTWPILGGHALDLGDQALGGVVVICVFHNQNGKRYYPDLYGFHGFRCQGK